MANSYRNLAKTNFFFTRTTFQEIQLSNLITLKTNQSLSTIKNYAPRNPTSLFVSIDDVDFEQDCWSVLCSLRSEIKKIPRTAICTSVPEEDEMFCDIGTDAESFSSQPSFSTVDRYGMFRIRSASSESSRSSSGSLMRFNRTFSDLSSMGSAK